VSWSAAQATWQRAESLGFDHAWTYDHIAWRSLRDAPWFGAVPTLAAAATATSRIRLGTLVASPNFRHPVPFARELLALDDISGGRFTLGIGAGGSGWDATVLGGDPWSPRERADRFAEFVQLTDELLRSPETSFDGRFYRAARAPMAPGCVQQPRIPFAIAATGPRGMAVVAAHAQCWVTNGDRTHEGPPLEGEAGVASVARQLRLLEEACAAADRDPASVDKLVLTDLRLASGLPSAERFIDTLGQYDAIGVTDFVVHWPRSTGPFAGDVATFEQAVLASR
jgi:alkanesulfonate monooxygenase SsuD/methylene tetrahydromethanopterin reductase-like flavin-dependent oxidoreductase (luciferase family)